MKVLCKEFLEFLYDAAHIQRWNDHIRPNGFTELDKQAHKMMILYILARHEEARGVSLDWRAMIEGGIIEFLHRIVLTDIKPPIFHKLMKERGRELNRWVYEQLQGRIPTINDDFINLMRRHFDDKEYKPVEKKILRAAHYLATQWEFSIIYHFNQGIYGVERTREAISNEIEDYYDLIGVQKLQLKGKTAKFVDLTGKLRFQKRWSQSPRVPETSVMGHVLIVAILGYYCAMSIGADDDRLVSDFICGLFHDLPEVLTRDIISPVKSSVSGLDKMIKDIEGEQVAAKILPLLPAEWHKDIIYYTHNEFANKCMVGKEIRVFETAEELQEFIEVYGRSEEAAKKPISHVLDGRILKGCDHMAAFMEAWLSIEHGIASKHLRAGMNEIRRKYTYENGYGIVGGVDFAGLYAQFK